MLYARYLPVKSRPAIDTPHNQALLIENLACMINEGFKSTATKEDIRAVNSRLDRIEHLLLAEQKQEIEDLKRRTKRLEDAFAVSRD